MIGQTIKHLPHEIIFCAYLSKTVHKRHVEAEDGMLSGLSHGVNKIKDKLGRGGNFPTDRDAAVNGGILLW